ncbi:uncharacterized protein lratb.1 isoform X4 [Syngnathoides biaculeatus]|uniref:uncharacterized protein lratb.1 isoform X4 n=1 Tax=Syngnathoides biaculeatus TaxID=300417 RepID=UPI002ADDF7E9|nr:uncharacterized protein lratb.1 isoform X4 [Syngnathoides biaculeatus]
MFGCALWRSRAPKRVTRSRVILSASRRPLTDAGPVRIGCASGFWGDTATSVPQLVHGGKLDFLVFDYLSEITMSLLTAAKAKAPNLGYAPDFVQAALAPSIHDIHGKGVRVVSNAGGVNPLACAAAIREVVKKAGLDLKVAVVTGDDLMPHRSSLLEVKMADDGSTRALPKTLHSANAYLGASPIRRCLDLGADVVVTGRCVDSALALGPLLHAFGWGKGDLDLLAAGSLAGHLIECGAQSTGGIFTDWRGVPDWDDIGFPVVECSADGSFILSKPPKTGGLVSFGTAAEQLVYEIGDPRRCGRRRREGERRQRLRSPARLQGVRHLHGRLSRDRRVSARRPESGGKGPQDRREHHKKNKAHFQAFASGRLHRCQHPSSGSGGHVRRQRIRQRRQGGGPVVGRPPQRKEGAGGLLQGDRLRWHRDGSRTLRHRGRASPSLDVHMDGQWVESLSEAGPDTTEQEVPPEGVEEGPDADGARRTSLLQTGLCCGFDIVELPGGPHCYTLEELAYARSGDKGDSANIGVIARHAGLFPYLRKHLTSSVVEEYLAHLFPAGTRGAVTRYTLPGINGLNFVLKNSLGGGGVASLRSDPQGKALAQMLLDLKLRGLPDLAPLLG